LLARAYDVAGRAPEARSAAALALAGAPVEPQIPRDVSTIDEIAISPDGAYVATVEHRYARSATVTVWDTLAGRATFSAPGA